MSNGPYWPDEEDAAVCAQLMGAYPIVGPGLCFMFGSYRTAGFSREVAMELALKEVHTPASQEAPRGTVSCQ
jgi:hypothetical protein